MVADRDNIFMGGKKNFVEDNSTGDSWLSDLARLILSSYKKKNGSNLGTHEATVIRVDDFSDGKCRVVCRITPHTRTELDDDCVYDAAGLPNPCEYPPSPDVKSDSQFVIDMHRCYEGNVATSPIVGQKCSVIVPAGNSHGKDGILVGMSDHFEDKGIKSCPGQGSGAKNASQAAAGTGPNIGLPIEDQVA